ncbi:DUF1489 family protein [Amphiplicatus metriothermophilus]|uniref:DUF1489 family protein n=1 Tax=Amphiplicatus metriothermophilus TaxID=1519374 RepID=A0A239PXV3_9PROT|nr:hypothetical protein SAMN06297382_2366 [Amphiplicatus metriothermophilus]
MTVHLVKLCVGAESVEDLAGWVARRAERNAREGRWGRVSEHVTRLFPRRTAELLDGGSLYWVIKGVVLARQALVGFEPVTGADGIARCAILLKPEVVPVEAQPRRAFQGWRYLRPEDAPRDLKSGARGAPSALRARLAELGLL